MTKTTDQLSMSMFATRADYDAAVRAQADDGDPRAPVVTGSPDTIWLCYGDLDRDATHRECVEVMWCEDKQHPSDVRYVRADADRVATMPEGLQMAVKLLAQIGDDDSDAAIAAVHAACDLARRVADLEKEQMRRAKAVKALNEIHETCGEEPWEYRRIALAALADDERAAASMSASPLLERIDELEAERDKAHQDAISAAVERDELRAKLAEIEAQEPVAHCRASDAEWLAAGRCTTVYKAPAEDWIVPLYARPVTAPAQAVPESVDGLVSVFCYDEVLTFKFRDEAAADKFAGRFDPSVDSAEAPEHRA